LAEAPKAVLRAGSDVQDQGAVPEEGRAEGEKPLLTFIYIVDLPDYQHMACYLLASIRAYFPGDVRAIGYCPEEKMAAIDPGVLRAHELMGAEIRPFRTEGRWEPAYPHGNKILAALEPRDSQYSAFVDSDVLFLRKNRVRALISPGGISCSVAASMQWGEQSVWDEIYGVFDMPVPTERVRLMRRSRQKVVPYFSSGLVVFPEGPVQGRRFPDVWYETAREIDRRTDLPKKRPYLDQMSLPVAIRRAGLEWNQLPEEQHFILGGKLRGEPFPADREIFTVHYRDMKILKEVGLMKQARAMLRQKAGSGWIGNLREPSAETGGVDE
jgi:hypothetical protein